MIDRIKSKDERTEDYVDRVTNELFVSLGGLGNFYRDEFGFYYLDNTTHTTFRIPSNYKVAGEFTDLIEKLFNMVSSDTHATKIFDRLFSRIRRNARYVTLHHLSYYNADKNTLYVRNSDTTFVKITTKGFKIIHNGEDGIIGKGKFEEVEIDPKLIIDDAAWLANNLYRKVWFDDNYTNAEQQGALLKIWTLSLFFGNIIKARPLLVMSGDAGTGKTTVLRAIGQMIFGSNFQVIGIPKDERDFVSSTIHNHLLAIDNVDDDLPDWFADKIAGVATGMGFQFRRLYTDVDAEASIVRPDCFFALTTRTPRFNRDDVAERCLVLNLRRDEDYSRNALVIDRRMAWHHLLAELQKALINFKKYPNRSYKGEVRMVEFADFVVRCSSPKVEKQVKELLETITSSQIEFATENNQLLDALVDIGSKLDEEFSAIELLSLLNSEYNTDIRNTISLGGLIRKYRGLIAKKKIPMARERRGGMTYYIFGSPPQTDNTKLVENTLFND